MSEIHLQRAMSDTDGGNVGHELAKKLEISLTQMIERLEVDSIERLVPNIVKVPADIRKGHDDAYVPKMFFIGPYHQKKEDISPAMEIELLYLRDLPSRDKERSTVYNYVREIHDREKKDHQKKEDISPAMKIKLLYLRDLLSRDKERNNVYNYVREIHDNENKARKQYSDDVVDWSSEEFVKMLVIDGCFIIEFLLKFAERSDLGFPFDSQVRNFTTLQRDLLLFENQIPFFILDKILQNSHFKLQNIQQENITLVDLALHYLNNGKIANDTLNRVHREKESIHHLLHLSYLCLTPPPTSDHPTTDQSSPRACHMLPPLHSSKARDHPTLTSKLQKKLKRSVRFIRNNFSLLVICSLLCIVHVLVLLVLWRKPSWSVSIGKSSTRKPRMLPTVTELTEAGVTFKRKKKKNADCYFDVSFDKVDGKLRMPLLSIQDITDSTFRNFLALEQICPNVGNYFTSYVVLMDNLIDTPSDVSFLKRRGLLESKLGSNVDVAELFNQMRSGLCFNFDEHDRAEMFQDINDYCNQEHNRWRAKLMHDYFSNPWACLSIAAAVLLLGFTAVQTGYTVRTYYD